MVYDNFEVVTFMLKTAKKVDNSLFPRILNIIVLGNILTARLLWENENFRFSPFFSKDGT